jgi:hypothetical protein
MDAAILIVTYIIVTAIVQGLGFLVSEIVDYEYPTAGLMTFLILFLGAFFAAWPIAVRIADRLISKRGKAEVPSET